MGTITTYSKIHFDPIHPDPAGICIGDIAHALSLLCRAGGHFSSFFSVCQHSINCMEEAKARGYSPKVQLACLLHDGSEAYLSDITRPVKEVLTQYRQIEDVLQAAIWDKFLDSPLTQEEYNQVFLVDDTMLYYEFFHYMGEALFDPAPKKYSQPQLAASSFADTEQSFLARFYALTEACHQD